MKIITTFFFFLIATIATCQDLQYYELSVKKRLKKSIDEFPTEIMPKGEKLKILSYEDSNLKVKNEKYEGYVFLLKSTFKGKDAKKRIEQVIFIDTHKDLLKRKNITKVPIRNDNTIIINTELSAKEAFKKFGNHLIENGYTFESKDDEFLSLTTDFKLLEYKGKDKLRYKLYISFLENKIMVKPKYDKIGLRLIKKKPVTDYLKNWNFKPNDKIKKNLLFWDIAPVIEGFNQKYFFSNENDNF